MKLHLAPHARADLDSIWIYVATESGSELIANQAIEAITQRFAFLVRFPYIGRRLMSELHPEVRTHVAEQYVIFYRPLKTEIRILRVIHASRDAFALFAAL